MSEVLGFQKWPGASLVALPRAGSHRGIPSRPHRFTFFFWGGGGVGGVMACVVSAGGELVFQIID